MMQLARAPHLRIGHSRGSRVICWVTSSSISSRVCCSNSHDQENSEIMKALSMSRSAFSMGARGKMTPSERATGMVLENWLQQTGWLELATKGYRGPWLGGDGMIHMEVVVMEEGQICTVCRMGHGKLKLGDLDPG
jgi:hypothetical protein